MKKAILITALLVGFCSSSFARIMIQGFLFGPGVVLENKNNGSAVMEKSVTDFYGGTFGLMWEFMTDEDNSVHYYMGSEIGGSDEIIFAFDNGLNISLTEIGLAKMELNLDLKIGTSTDIANLNQYVSLSADLLFLDKTRRGLYGGIGISNQIFGELNFFDYESNHNKNIFSLNCFAGIKI